MKKAKKIVVGNWKMNPETLEEAKKIASDIKKGLRNIKKTKIILCPPSIYLTSLSGYVSTNLLLGSQNVFSENVGSFTGEVSPLQFSNLKTSFVLVGHSERRALGESDEIVARKVRMIIAEGMTAILCVGEKDRDHHGDYLGIIREQIISGLKDISKKSLERVVIAYEPVWAIGGRKAMEPREIHEMYIYIKKVLREIYGLPSDSIIILYGGAVDINNAQDIVKNGFVQGLLIGRESLNAKNFVEIVKQIETL